MEVTLQLQPQPQQRRSPGEYTSTAPPLIFAGTYGCTHEEEITVDGHRVTWHTGHLSTPPSSSSSSSTSLPHSPHFPAPPSYRVLQCFNHSSAVLSALFARFPSLSSPSASSASSFSGAAASSRYLVLVHPDCLSIYAPSGDQFAVPLPFRVASAFALLEGLLLQRTPHQVATASHAQPTLFSLLHPLEEVRPLSRVERLGLDEQVEEEVEMVEGPMMSDDDERLLWSSEHQPLLVTWTSTSSLHRVYLVRQSVRERSRRCATAEGQGDGRLIHSELLLHGCQGLEGWHSPPAASIFHSSTVDGEPLLCFCVGDGTGSSQLCAFHLQPHPSTSSSPSLSSSLHLAFTLPALSACPIAPLFSRSSTPAPSPDVDPHRSDIVVLSPHDHSISVYQGQHLLITLKPFALPSPPLSLSHPVGSRLSLHTATNSYRVHLAQAVHSPLVHCCFSALAYALPVQGMLGLKTDWLATRERQRTSEEVGDAVASEWRVFAPLLLELLSPAPPSLSSASTAQPQRELSPPLPPASAMSQMSASPSRKSSRHTRQISTSPPPPHRAADADAWSLLVASNHHRQWSRHPVLAHLTASVDIPTPTPSASAHDPKRQKTSATVSASLSLSSRELLQPHAAAVLLALHLTYEGFKLDQLHHCHLHPLATLCHGIAVRSCAAEWCDAYQRDWPELITHRPVGVGSSSLSAATLTSPPPSIFRWLHHRLSGDPRGVERFPIPQASLADPHSPFELLRRICECYELMTQPVLARSSYAQPGEDDRLQGLSDPTGGSRRSAAQTPSALRSHGRPSSSRLSQATPLSSLSSSTRSDRSITIDTHPLFSPSPTPPVRRTTRPSPDRLLSSSSSSAALVSLLSSFSATALSRLPFGVSAPLYRLLLDSRPEPSSALLPAALDLIGRPDLARMKLELLAAASSRTAIRPSLLEQMETTAGRPQTPSPQPPSAAGAGESPADVDGTLLSLSLASFRFGSDLRLKQVRHLLRSTRLVSLTLTRDRLNEIEASNGSLDLQFEYQSRLPLLARRILALPIARGMFTLSSFTPPLTTPFPIPPLTLSARVHPKLTTLDLEPSHLPFDFLDWPHFHNATAAALRIRPTTAITSAFTLYNQPSALSYSHAGWLFGLGLMGGLACLSTADLYRYLSQHHDGVTIALLLGTSAVKRRTMDVVTSKMLCLHIPAFLPSHLEPEIGLLVKTAAAIGLGLLYEASAHRLMAEVLLHEIDNRGQKERNKDREQERSGYALAAGFGLGLVMLGRGGDAPGVSDLKLEDQLVTLLQGGWRGKEGREGSALKGGDGVSDRTQGEGKGGRGALIDLDVTTPAATVALALMYLHSNNVDIASHLTIPQNHYEMDDVKADFLLLRSLARSLIMAGEVKPSRAWVEGQVPKVMRDTVKGMQDYEPWQEGVTTSGEGGGKMEEEKVAVEVDDSARDKHAGWGSDDEGEGEDAGHQRRALSEVIEQADLDGLLLNDDDGAGHRRRNAVAVEDDEESSDDADEGGDDVDYEACRQGYCNIIAGSCLALGMLFAGTADASACHVLSYYVRCFRAIRLQHRDSFNAANSATHPSRLHYLDRHTCETCLLSCMLALAMVMAGSGDLATLRLFLSLHQRVDERHTVGRQQGFFMAIGLLFLGGGEWSLKRGREGAVGLLLSMFPFFGGGAGTNENRLYLQALRHLYTLSAECRAMKAVEVDSGKESYCRLQVQMREDGRVLQLITPCLLPHVDRIASVRIDDTDYWPIVATFSSSSSPPTSSTFTFPLSTSSPYILHVKRRSSHVLRELDATSFVELMSRVVKERQQQREAPALTAWASPATASTSLMAGESQRMLQAACGRDDIVTAYRWLVEGEGDDQVDRASLLLRCVRGDQLHVLPLHLHLRRLLSTPKRHLDGLTVQNLRLLQALDVRMTQQQLLPPESVALVLERVHTLLTSPSPTHLLHRYLDAAPPISAAHLSSAAAHGDGKVERRARVEDSWPDAALIAWLDLPSAAQLRSQLSTLRAMARDIDRTPGRQQQLLPVASILFPSLSVQALQLLLEATS